MAKPVIAINCNFEERDRPLSTVATEYYDCVTDAGGLPLLLAPLSGEKDIESLLALGNGLILTGSKDIPPHLWGESRIHPKTQLIHPRRTEFDFKLLRAALKKRIPVLAICGGMQEVNVALGGDIIQDISDLRPNSLPHRKRRPYIAAHRITVKPGTLLHKVLGTEFCVTNSYHHQAVRNPAPGLIVSAVCEDGIIEAIEPRRKAGRFLLAVQWHPERMRDDRIQTRLFTWLVQTAKDYSARRSRAIYGGGK
jgi:putative glutamine amidotransferase